MQAASLSSAVVAECALEASRGKNLEAKTFLVGSRTPTVDAALITCGFKKRIQVCVFEGES
jgi:hypothetical protein